MRKFSILVVEDNEVQRELYTLLLEMEGFAVTAVTDGQAALAELQYRLPDVILTDIAMPDMDGLELVKFIRDNEKFTHIPIVVMTAFNSYYLKWADCVGANRTIAKPFEPEDLFATILQVLLLRGQEQDLQL